MGFQYPTDKFPEYQMQISIAPRTIEQYSKEMVSWGVGHELVHYAFILRENHWRHGQATFQDHLKHHCNPEFKQITRAIADEFWKTAANTDVFLIPGNWPASRREHWMSLLRARAIENQAFVIGCNRVGSGGGLSYAGDSRVINPLGEVIAEAQDLPTILYADISAEEVQSVRTTFPFMQDRR
jgi:hypothetical protein